MAYLLSGVYGVLAELKHLGDLGGKLVIGWRNFRAIGEQLV